MTSEWSAGFSSLTDCFRRHQAFVNGLVYDRCGDAAIAEEVTAQTFEAAAARFAQGRGHEVTPAWLAVVARRRLIDHWRRNSARKRVFERVAREPATTIDESPDDDHRVSTALDSLPQRQRTVLTLCYVDGWSVREIAAGLGITYLAAESLLSRSRLVRQRTRAQPTSCERAGAREGVAMRHQSESPEIESAIEQLSARGVRSRPLRPGAEQRILARLERAFENVDHTDLELTVLDRPETVSRQPVTIAAVAAMLVLISLSAAVLLNNGTPNAPASPPADASSDGAVENPLMTRRSELTDQASVELFRVNADAEVYWRVTTLPEFDGRTFRLPSGALSRVENGAARPEGRTIRQQIEILGLTNNLVPAAADVYQVVPNDDLRLNADTGSLLKLTDLATGDQFTIVSIQPEVTPDELRAATTVNPADEIFLGLPDDLPSDISGLAAEVTAGATTDYDRLIALQDWLRTNFEYTTDVEAGNGSDAIEQFLEVRRGYCEQFAATFAVMARTLGIPSRVAVGYTPGALQPDGWYVVTGANSHAWPEVWFDGIGWIPFEPTPQRDQST